MNLVVVFQRFGPYPAARVNALSAAGVRVTAVEVCSADATYAWDPLKPFVCDRVALVEGAGSVTFSELCGRMSAALDACRADIVAIPGWSSQGAMAALISARRAGIPAILMSDSTAHDESRVWLREVVKRRVVRLFSSALVGGLAHVEYATALGMARERIFTGYDVVDNEHFARGAAQAQGWANAARDELNVPERYFLASNRFIEKKNLSRLLQGFSKYRARAGHGAWDLVLLGDGGLRAQLERQVMELGLHDAVHMPGFKQYNELPKYYGLASAFVHASTTEQWGLVVNEAMACGLPVIISNRCGCAPELVEEGANGYTFDPLDVDSLVELMLKMAGGDSDRAAMGAASRRIISEWTPQTFSENLLAAAEVALAVPRSKSTPLDSGLLRLLAWR